MGTIIAHTASRIASNNQLEVFLKLKQSSTSDFAFLHPTNPLHGYYRWLVTVNSRSHAEIAPCSRAENVVGSRVDESNASVNPLSGLLGGYTSSSDDSAQPIKSEKDEPPCSPLCRNEPDADGESNPADNQTSDEKKKRKAERLERLRLWKVSRFENKDDT